MTAEPARPMSTYLIRNCVLLRRLIYAPSISVCTSASLLLQLLQSADWTASQDYQVAASSASTSPRGLARLRDDFGECLGEFNLLK